MNDLTPHNNMSALASTQADTIIMNHIDRDLKEILKGEINEEYYETFKEGVIMYLNEKAKLGIIKPYQINTAVEMYIAKVKEIIQLRMWTITNSN